jgi:hypothetical protein
MMPGGMPGMTRPGQPYQDWRSMERNDPEMFKFAKEDSELEQRTRELSAQYRQAPEPRREEIRKELAKLVERHFEVRQQRRQLEVQRMEKELSRLRDALERRSKAREELVNKRVNELLGEHDEAGF